MRCSGKAISSTVLHGEIFKCTFVFWDQSDTYMTWLQDDR